MFLNVLAFATLSNEMPLLLPAQVLLSKQRILSLKQKHANSYQLYLSQLSELCLLNPNPCRCAADP